MFRWGTLADQRHGSPRSLPWPLLSRDWLTLLSYGRLSLTLFRKSGCPSHPAGGAWLLTHSIPEAPGQDQAHAGTGRVGSEVGPSREGSKAQSSHLEEALAALTCPHPVVLAGGIISADSAGAFPGGRAPAGRRREATAAAAAALAHQAGGGCVEAERWEG